MAQTKIEWTATVLPDGRVLPGYTFNPWWGCIKVSAECTNCYAETFAHRYGHEVWGPEKTTERRFFGDKHWAAPVKWNYEAEKSGIRRKVFCASMSDVFEDNASLELERLRLFNLIAATPHLDWLLLTKRPENILKMVPPQWFDNPLPNVWLGTSVGVNDTRWRIDELRKARSIAQVLFLSMEPLLEEVQILDELSTNDIDWVIVGGESGGGKRPFDIKWAKTVLNNCRNFTSHNIAFFMKQIDKVQEIPPNMLIREYPVVERKFVTDQIINR